MVEQGKNVMLVCDDVRCLHALDQEVKPAASQMMDYLLVWAEAICTGVTVLDASAHTDVAVASDTGRISSGTDNTVCA